MARHKTRTILKALAILAGLLIIVRISLPFAAQWYINDVLDEGEEFTGSVGDVDIMLWRGAYSLDDVVILKRTGEVEQPFFEAKQVEFSLLWNALLDKALVAQVDLTAPELNFVDGKSVAESQSGENENWLYLADQLVPLKVDRFEIRRGIVRFINPDSEPAVNIELHDIHAVARNLVNSRSLSKDLIATIEASGNTEQQGTITLSGSLNPATKNPTFDVNLQANDVALVNFKNFLDTYAPFDLEAGTLELALELASDDGEISGYTKPILHQVEVFSWKGDIEEDDDGFFRGLAEALSAFIAELFENQSEDQIATRIPISGSLNDVDTPVLATIGGILKNAFIQAINGNLEDSVQWRDAEEAKEEKEQEAAGEENPRPDPQ
ncbi:DUF748 domain-containing protein [Alteromonas sp. NFXS44]|uniref:DUF748 domain-containing protein n=1 Tax=Alteromonas sp. NFXS44 TaxID=2818435 RepID=UPI0032DF382B